MDIAQLVGDPVLLEVFLRAIGGTPAGVCLCDPDDNVRFANATFRTSFFPGVPLGAPVNYVDATVHALRQGQGVTLVARSPGEAAPRIRRRRTTTGASHSFTADLPDGRSWWVTDHTLGDGWMLVVANETSVLRREEARLRDAHASALQAAQTDFLTGIANRRWGFERAEAALRAGSKIAAPVTVALLDIDHFKQINDRRGHEVGDRVLVHFAAFVAGAIRRQDQVSRIGGEEFLLVLPGADAAGAELVLGRLLGELPPMAMGDDTPPIRVTASAGLARARPQETLEQLLARADQALYDAKQAGRDRIVVSHA